MSLRELREDEHYEIAVSANGDTLWVNGEDGTCWARFSKRWGIDVHRSEAMGDAPHCLYCTHGQATATDWETFRAEVLKHHGINVIPEALTFA